MDSSPHPQGNPIKTMLIGMALMALITAFFTVSVSGKTTFNHILGLFGGDEAPAAETPTPK